MGTALRWRRPTLGCARHVYVHDPGRLRADQLRTAAAHRELYAGLVAVSEVVRRYNRGGRRDQGSPSRCQILEWRDGRILRRWRGLVDRQGWGRRRPQLLRVVDALIPRYGDCEAHWLPADQSVGRHGSLTTSRRISSSTARAARSGSSAAAEDHSSDPAPTPRYLASAQGEAQPVASARPGSGRSRFASHRRRIRLEARGQVKAAIRPHDSVQHSSPPRCGKAVENLGCRSAVARWASSGRSGDFTTLGPECSHSNGGRAKKTSERARTSAPHPKRLSPSRRSYGAAVRDTR